MIIKAVFYFATAFLQMSFPGFLSSCHSRVRFFSSVISVLGRESKRKNKHCHVRAWPGHPEIPGTRCACPRTTEEKIILSFLCLARESAKEMPGLNPSMTLSSVSSCPAQGRTWQAVASLTATPTAVREPLLKRVVFCLHIVSKCLVFFGLSDQVRQWQLFIRHSRA